MTTEKLKELFQARLAFFGQHLSDDTLTAQLKGYTAVLGTVPDDIAEQAFYMALGNCRYPSQFLVDWKDAARAVMRKDAPSNAELWKITVDAAYYITDELEREARGGWIDEPQGASYKRVQQRFDSLPQAIREWAYSPQGLCELVGNPNKNELECFVRPKFEQMLDDSPVCMLKPSALTRLSVKAEPSLLNQAEPEEERFPRL